MITPSDNDYIITKQIKQGTEKMNPDFLSLASWFKTAYDIQILNIIHDFMDGSTPRPRLTIIFEFWIDERKFMDGSTGNAWTEKQKLVADKFNHFVNTPEKSSKYDTTNLWVVFSSFEPIAKDEANSRVPEEDVKALAHSLNNKDLWMISRMFSGTTFFLHTDEQLKRYEHSRERTAWANKYFDLLDLYNEFGYFTRETFAIYMDSKENFDNNYASKWYYYYK